MLKLATNLHLPDDAVTQTFGFFGRKGSGKTYGAGKLAETLLDAKAQVVILDGVGNWFGLRLDPSGKRASRFTLPILGGEQGDVPLQPQGGAIVADFVVNTGSSVIVDVSRFRKHERKEFVTAFAEELFHKKKSNRTPMHFIIEEAQLYAPQKTFKGEERMLGAMEDIVRLGRNYGIGSSMISQRPQSVNTEIRNQCEPLVVFQLVAHHERQAIKDWMEHMGVDSDLEALAKLHTGECFFWSPAWLDKFIKTKFFQKETFDASATPTLGAAVREPKKLDPVDLTALEAAMSSTIERAKADDPRELKRQIGELKRQLKQPPASIQKPVDDKKLEAAVSKAVEQTTKHFRQEAARVIAFAGAVKRQAEVLKHEAETLIAKLEVKPDMIEVLKLSGMQQETGTVKINLSRMAWANRAPADLIVTHNGDGDITGPEQRILNAIAWLNSIGIEEPNQTAVCFLAGYTWGGGGFNNPRGSLHTKGLVEYLGSRIRLTEDGKKFAHVPDEILDAQQLQARVFSVLPGPERKILKPLIEAYPEPLTNEELAEASGYTEGGGGLNNPRGRLRTLGLIDYPSPGLAIASSLLFLE